MLLDAPVLRALHPSDLPAAQRISASMSWPHRLEDWRAMLATGHGIAAINRDGALLGTTLWWPFGAAACCLGMVLVDAARQGLGIGRRLMGAALEQIGPRAIMLNATEAGLALYQKLGFRIAGRVTQHQGVFGGIPIAGNAFECTRPAKAGDHPAILALDQRGFGAKRTDFIRDLLVFNPCRVVESGGIVTGFALHRHFGRGSLLGPMMAASEADAIALVASSLQPGFQRIDIPAEATGLSAWLTGAGLPAVDSATTMLRGEWGVPDPGIHRFALASQAMG